MPANLPSDTQAELYAASLILHGAPNSLNFPWEEGMFTSPHALAIYKAVVRLSQSSQPIDAMTVCSSALDSKDITQSEYGSLLVSAGEGYGASGSLDYYFSLLSSLHTRRKMIRSLLSGAQSISKGLLCPSQVLEEISEASKEKEVKSFPSLKEQLMELLQFIENNKTKERFSTGLQELDQALDGGYEKGEFVVFAGETSTGKSVLLQMAALALVRAAKKTAFYSLEMPSTAILARMASNAASCSVIFHGPPNQQQAQAINRAINQLAKLPLIIRDSIFSLHDIIRDAKQQIDNGAEAIVIDYIQRVEYQTKESREQAVAEVTRQMKRLAMEKSVAVLSASQLNEEGKVRESRAISQDCDILCVIKDGHLSLDKFRRGERFKKIGCKLNGALARFVAAEYNPEEKPKYKKKF